MMIMRSLLLGALVAGCGTQPPVEEAGGGAAADGTVNIVVSERGPYGGRLVALGEDGRRIDELTTGTPGGQRVRDTGAAFSPDGAWVVFASNRDREKDGESSLWIVAARIGAEPKRLTATESTDLDPVFTADGRSILYSSITRTGTSLDLWRADVDLGAAGGPALRGQPTQLTRTPEHELTPSPSPDGSRIAFAVASDEKGSAIWVMDHDGQRRQLTRGPGDVTPSWSPDGRTIAFASGRERDLGKVVVKEKGEVREKTFKPIDTDLFLVEAAGGQPRLVIDEPNADQTGPRWSRDGRYLFATSLVRSAKDDKPVLVSVVFVDRREKPMVLRALHDPGGEEQRSSPALGRAVLDARALHEQRSYHATACQALKALYQRSIHEQFCKEAQKKDPKFICPEFREDPRWSEVCKTAD